MAGVNLPGESGQLGLDDFIESLDDNEVDENPSSTLNG